MRSFPRAAERKEVLIQPLYDEQKLSGSQVASCKAPGARRQAPEPQGRSKSILCGFGQGRT